MTNNDTSMSELREAIELLNGQGGHACYCDRAVDRGCTCALKDEHVDYVLSLITTELTKARIDEVRRTRKVRAYSGVVERYLYQRYNELQAQHNPKGEK